MAKTWQADGTITPYNKAKYFDLEQIQIGGIDDLSEHLKRLEGCPNTCIIRGHYVGGDLAKERIPENEYKNGKVLRRNSVFDDQPLHTLLIEVDDFEPEFSDLNDTLGCIREYIAFNLPKTFFDASFHWQLSNSAGHSTKQGKLKVHLWFWLAKARTSAELRAWAVAIKLKADHSVFKPTQVHYTAAPNFEKGVTDPIPVRSGFVRGIRDDVELESGVIDAAYPYPKDEAQQKPTQYDDDLDRIFALDEVTNKTIEDLRSALMGMKPERADDYKLWIDVLESLASLKETSFRDEAYGLAHEFSERCPEKYDSEYLDKIWVGLNPTMITHRSIFKWAQEDGWINPRSTAALKAKQSSDDRIDRTDAGNTTQLAIITDGNLRYVPERQFWLWWDGYKWLVDQYGTIAQDCVLKVAEYYYMKAAELRNQTNDKSLDASECKRIERAAENMEKWAAHCRNRRAIESMLCMAKADKRFMLPLNELDHDPWLFGVENGVVDLRTGSLREASRDEYVTRRSPVRFNPAAKAIRWCQFIEEITAFPDLKGSYAYKPRPNLANYLQCALGYAMTGSTAEQKMFICIGTGSNGKNILLDMLQWIMGDYCQTIPPEALMAAKYGSDAERPSPTTAMLKGARAAIGNESKDGQRLDVALVKRHTGGGYITARYMRENTFRFEITHKLWLMTNHRPALDHMDEALRGRLHLLPFDMRWNRPGHPEHNPLLPDGDKDLLEKLKAEAEGILAWLIAGAVKYANKGLEPSAEVMGMTKSYFQENDLLGLWLEDSCEQCDAKLGMKASELYVEFRGWSEEEGHSNVMPHNQKAFSNELVKRGIPKLATKDGKRYGLKALVDLSSVTGDG